MAPDPRNQQPAPAPAWTPILRRLDQLPVAILVAGALLGIAVYWFASGGFGGQLIEIDRSNQLRAPFVVDINEAPWPELAQLPGIGETLARRIVASRDLDGLFLDNRELLRVNGIGPKTLSRVEPFLLPLPGSDNVAGGPRPPGAVQ